MVKIVFHDKYFKYNDKTSVYFIIGFQLMPFFSLY